VLVIAGRSPNNVAARLNPVIQEGEARVGSKVGKAHDGYLRRWRRLDIRIIGTVDVTVSQGEGPWTTNHKWLPEDLDSA
jgi:hypothetical protein